MRRVGRWPLLDAETSKTIFIDAYIKTEMKNSFGVSII